MTTSSNGNLDELSSQQIDQIAAALARVFIAKAEQLLYTGHGVSARNVHRLHAADVDQNFNQVNQRGEL